MSLLTVGTGQQYQTIAAAVNAAGDGDTLNVQAGTYTNDFAHITKSLTLNAVGGQVVLDATVSPPDGKAIITEGAPGLTVNINGFTFQGAQVPDTNGAGIRYEGGTLNITHSAFFNNQNGILGAVDPAGVITVDHSEFGFNGVGGDGHTHNIYVGAIAQFTLTNSYMHDANIGHEVKSRAANNTLTGNVIADNNSTSSYEVDLPNGGNATITNNVIEQGPNSQNPNIIAIGEEGTSNPTSSIVVAGNTIVNDLGRGPALWNATGTVAQFSNNTVYGFGGNALVNGPANTSGTTVAATRPNFTEAVPVDTTPIVPTPIMASNPQVPSSSSGLVLNISEDAWQGDAQFTLSVDGQQVGGVRTATALHGQGSSQEVVIGALPDGAHTVGVTFLNDAWGGTPDTDRNLYVDRAFYNGQAIQGASATLDSAGTISFVSPGDQPAGSVPTPMPTPTPVPVAPTPAPNPVTAPASSDLSVSVSEDAYLGDAQFVVLVDGQQIGGTHTATALHGQGQTQAFDLGNVLSPGQHQVGVSFLNDACAGTPATDRNLYVDAIAVGGQSQMGAQAALYSQGTDTFGVTAAGGATPITSTLVLNMSEDAYQGDAQFIVAVDGQQVGGVYTTTASHAAGQSEAVTISGIPEFAQPHDIALTFLNDRWDGTAATDRNLYLNSAQIGGQPVPGGSLALYSTGTQHITALAPSNWTG